MSKLILYCLPHAGGSATMYKRHLWEKYLDSSIEIVPIELAGRGKRFSEQLYKSLNEAVDDIYDNIKRQIDKYEYAIFGHSMGSLLAYELYYKIKEYNRKLPFHIFFSGYNPPHIKKEKIIHNLPEEEFKKEIIELDGTLKEIYENKEIFDLFIPILRSDYKIIEQYKYIERQYKINCPITVLSGKNDDIFTNLNQWKNHTQNECNIEIFEGGHFFINTEIEKISYIINNTLINTLTK